MALALSVIIQNNKMGYTQQQKGFLLYQLKLVLIFKLHYYYKLTHKTSLVQSLHVPQWFKQMVKFTVYGLKVFIEHQWPGLSPYSRRQIPFIRSPRWSTNVGIRLLKALSFFPFAFN